MKKILSWCGSHTELLCAFFLLGCCINSAVKEGWSVAILFLPFIAMWIFVYRLQKEILRLIKKNKELKETYKQLEKAYDRTEDLKELCFYRYLFAKNDVDLCKKKISCSDYLSSRRHFEDKIVFYIKKLLAKGVR
jgi:hypothetical protein|nr:MAG TPA: PAC2 family protein [Caudoviricetes sp.]